MPINPPPIDNRDYADILREAVARIPVHNPAWTNFNDSDPGITIIQLFAFMTESILFRANQIPERNRLKFLQLLGISLPAATAARGFVTINNEKGLLASRVQPGGLDVRAGQIRFRTAEQGLEVLPITAQFFYKRPVESDAEQQALYNDLYADLLGENRAAAFYETTPMPQPEADGTLPVLDLATTVDGCLWIALLARPQETPAEARSHLINKTLTLGVMPRLDNTNVTLTAGQTTRQESNNPISWEIADAAAPTLAAYRPLTSRATAPILTEPGLVELDLPATAAQLTSWDFTTLEPGLEGTGEYPPSLADTNLSDRLITWIRLRVKTTGETTRETTRETTEETDNVSNPSDGSNNRESIAARISWVGINATEIQQTVSIVGEVLGNGNGEPDQVFQLANAPIIPDSLTLTVEAPTSNTTGNTTGNTETETAEPWQVIDDLLTADPEVLTSDPRLPLYQQPQPSAFQNNTALSQPAPSQQKVFSLDAESGQITFGDGAHGTRPIGRIVANYTFGGGQQGNVGIGSINRSPQLPPGYKVTNPIRTWGGDDAPDMKTAEKSISRTVQHRDRLVSVQDFEDITDQTPGVDIGRVAVLPLFVPAINQGNTTLTNSLANIPGAITIMVIPQQATGSTQNNNPQPDQFFLDAVCRHLQPRRLVTTELYVRGPEYIDLWISVGIELLGGYAAGAVREAIKQTLTHFLSPLTGGQPSAGNALGTGWPLNVSVLQAELEAVVSRVAGVRLVNDPLRLGTATADDVSSVEINGLQLPRIAGISVVSGGPAIPLDQVRRSPDVTGNLPDGVAWTPIPVLPERC